MNKNPHILFLVFILFLGGCQLGTSRSPSERDVNGVNNLLNSETYTDAKDILEKWSSYDTERIRKMVIALLNTSRKDQQVKPVGLQNKAYILEHDEKYRNRESKTDKEPLFFDIQTTKGRCTWAITELLRLNPEYFFRRIHAVSDSGVSIIPIMNLPETAQKERTGSVEHYKTYKGPDRVTELLRAQEYKKAKALIHEWENTLNEHEIRNLLMNFARASKNKHEIQPIADDNETSPFDINTFTGRLGWATSELLNIEPGVVERKTSSDEHSFTTAVVSLMRLPASVHLQKQSVENRVGLAKNDQIMMFSEKLLDELKTDDFVQVRRALASNPLTPVSILLELNKDKNNTVKEKAKNNMVFAHPRLTPVSKIKLTANDNEED